MKRIWVLALLLCMQLSCARAQIMYIDAGDADRVHLREAPSLNSKSYGLYFSGTPAEAKERVNDFTAVSIGTENGFIMSQYLKEEPDGIDSALRVGTIKTGVSYVNLRRYAAGEKVIGDVDRSDTVIVMGETANGWYYVKHGDTTGYMKSSLVRLGKTAAMESVLREQMIFVRQGKQVTAELYDIGGGEYEREYRMCFFQDGKEIFAADFTGDVYEHLRHFESDGGSKVMHVTDVNMDGHADVSVIRYTGATDAEAAHFLYDPQSGDYKRYRELDVLSWWRCEFYPQRKMMLNHQRDNAVCGTWTLYQWQGMELETIAVGSISYADASGERLRASVLRGGDVIYEETWSERNGDGSIWQQQTEAMLGVLLGGAEPGESVLLSGIHMGKVGGNGRQ